MNVFDYLNKYGGLSFDQLPLTEVDILMLTELSYLDLEKICPYYVDGRGRLPLKSLNLSNVKELGKRTTDASNCENLIRKMAKAPRYADIGVGLGLSIHDPRRVIQYASFTFFLPNNNIVIAYRGTDTTLLGWKENFQLAFKERIPSHDEALEYAEQILAWYPGCPVYITGHSKGGNLASFVTLHLKDEDLKRVVCSYNFDGPDFRYAPPTFEERKHLIQKYMTKEDVIGCIFNLMEKPNIVIANSKLCGGHNPFSWRVDVEARQFVRAKDRSAASYAGQQAFMEAIEQTSEEDIQLASEALFKVFWGCDTIYELGVKLIPAFLNRSDALSAYTPDERNRIRAFFERLLAALLESGAKKLAKKQKEAKE